MVDWSEFSDALAETRRYLLSHHEPHDHYRTYLVSAFGRRARLCARCTGVYPGIAAGLLAGIFAGGWFASLLFVALLPAPALVEWTATRFTPRRGYNAVRTATGLLLGYAYGLGAVLFLGRGDRRVLLVGLGYGIVAFVLLTIRERRRG
ncbi:hypothetical protein GCM10028857_25670 [Salinarchaeum chitinilyticum]